MQAEPHPTKRTLAEHATCVVKAMSPLAPTTTTAQTPDPRAGPPLMLSPLLAHKTSTTTHNFTFIIITIKTIMLTVQIS